MAEWWYVYVEPEFVGWIIEISFKMTNWRKRRRWGRGGGWHLKNCHNLVTFLYNLS
jgi:hypothetical protein